MSDLKRLEDQLDQLEKSYKLGIISDDEYKKGRENLEKKIEPLKEKKKKDEESKKIVDEILSEDKKADKKDKKKTVKKEEGEKSMPKKKDKAETKEKKEEKKETEKKAQDKGAEKEPKKEIKPSANEKRKKRPSKKSRVPKWLWILLLLLAVLAFITFTSPGEEEEPDPLARNVTGINETIQIEYYKSYACDYCMNTHETLEKLKDIYNHTVNISYIHYPYNIELDFEMDMAFECAKPHNAKGYSIKLYNATKPLEKEDMIELFNGNQTEFAECLNGNQTAEKVLKDYQRSLEDGIESVPTIKIDGSMLKGNRGIGVYMAIIDNELGIEP